MMVYRRLARQSWRADYDGYRRDDHSWRNEWLTCVQRSSVDNSAFIVGVVFGRHLSEFDVT